MGLAGPFRQQTPKAYRQQRRQYWPIRSIAKDHDNRCSLCVANHGSPLRNEFLHEDVYSYH